MLRSTDTHELHLFRQAGSDDTDAFAGAGDWTRQWILSVEAYERAPDSSGGSARTSAGTVTEADFVAGTSDARAANIDEGDDHAVLVPRDGAPGEAFIVDYVQMIAGRYGSPEYWRLYLLDEPANDVARYDGSLA